jgi:dextranase
LELLPLKATFAVDEPIALELRAATPARAHVFHLDRLVAEADVAAGQTVVEFPPVAAGGYGVELTAATRVARSAFDVLADPLERPRYGFVARYERDRNVSAVVDHARRLHLNAIQFYDWMYRHAQLWPPDDDYDDPLGRRLSLGTVVSLARELRAAGSLPLAYAAVYAVGRDAWPAWDDHGLYRADGTPWTLGDDFLWIVDPTDARWLTHFTSQLRHAASAGGFAGFHLDQYGDPKLAVRRDGTVVDLAEAFPALIARVRAALPEARLIFNNVNNFPTWATAAAAQDATYVEVWPPHTRLEHLTRLIRDARTVAPRRPVILAAYMSVFASATAAEALAAARLVMATVFSHGAFHLLTGEDGAVLTDPYYVDHHVAAPTTTDVLRQWYDFAVRYGDLLYDLEAIDVTTAVFGGVNKDVIVEANTRVSSDPERGAIWLRAVVTSHGLVVHLIDLSAAADTVWDAAKRVPPTRRGVRLRLRRLSNRTPSVHVASPESQHALVPAATTSTVTDTSFRLPDWRDWALVLIRGNW